MGKTKVKGRKEKLKKVSKVNNINSTVTIPEKKRSGEARENKNAIFRMTILDRCFSAGTYTIKGLIKEVEKELLEKLGKNKQGNPPSVSERTIKGDIANMQKAFPNCILIDDLKNKSPFIYRYEDPNYSIFGLSTKQKKKIKHTLSALSRFSGQPQYEWVREKIAEIRRELNLSDTDEHSEVMSFETYSFYEFQEGNKMITHPGLEYVTAIFNAIVNKNRVLEIYYQDFDKGQPYVIKFHPYYLKQFNLRWYAFGYYPSKKNPTWAVAIDRIVKDPNGKIPAIKEVDDNPEPNKTDWKNHFEDIIGVTKRNEEPIEIRILVKDFNQKEYIRTRPLHISQKPFKEMSNGEYETSINVIPNYELYKLLLSFGERIKVLSPDLVKEEMKKKVNGMYKDYL